MTEEQDRLIKTLAELDEKAAKRMYGLRWFMFWLPFIWGIIFGFLWLMASSIR